MELGVRPIEEIRIETFRKEPIKWKWFILCGEQTSLSFTGVEFQKINVSQPDTISSLKVKRSTMTTMVMLVDYKLLPTTDYNTNKTNISGEIL